MTATQRVLNLSIELSGVILCALAILFVLSSTTERKTRRYFVLFYLGLILLAASNIAGILMKGLPGRTWRAALYASNYIEFLMPTLLAYIVSHYLLSLVDPEGKRRGWRLALLALLTGHIVLLTVSQFTGLYYTIDADNFYRRSPAYPLSLVMTTLMLGLDMIILVKNRRALSTNEYGAFLLYFTMPFVSVILQSVQYGINYTIFATIAAGLVMYIVIIRTQTVAFYRQREDNIRLQTDIMLSQIKPHFLYNSLGAIQSLCRSDPAAAEQAVAEFSRYLRGNMNALATEKTIPFAQELAHTKTYLALEKLRYEDDLQLRYELRCTDFRIPPLTLQPIAENAVRHGVRGNASGRGTVCIASAEYPDRWEITVTDDGPGFDPAQPPADGNAHIGLQNVRERLKRAVDGELRIEASPGNGTKVTIILPKEGNSLADLRDR